MDHVEAQNLGASAQEEDLNLSSSEGLGQGASAPGVPEDPAEALEALAAEVASAAAHAIDFLSPPKAWPSSPVHPQGLSSDTSALAKGVAFAAAAGAADAAAVVASAADDAESTASDVAAEDSAADEDASWW